LETITLVLLMLLLVVASGFIVRILPFGVPLPLVQIVLGAIIAVSSDFRVGLNPDIFFLLFLPPLLFIDGWRIPKSDLFRDLNIILEMALGLVVFTVVGMGYLIHWLMPAMPLPVAFALAAVLSPTDPVAVSAIAARTPIPKRMMHILEGESLLNDASGLVCLRFAVAAALSGHFSLPSAFVAFSWLAGGGIMIGVALTFGVGFVKLWLSRRLGEEVGTQILISLLIPFGAYMAAEHLHCSGILAAVAAGISMSYVEAGGQAMAITRIRRNVVWDTVQFAANGAIFVLLGQQLPALAANAAVAIRETEHISPLWISLYIVVIVAGLAALRFLWVWVSIRFTVFKAYYRGQPFPKVHWRLVAAMSAAGVRGAITLAGILTLPLVMNDGTRFPARDLAIFIAASVIILSLAIASVGLPRLLKGLDLPETSTQAEEDMARMIAAKAAIQAVEKALHDLAAGRSDADLYANAGARVMNIYRQRLDDGQKMGIEKETLRKTDQAVRELYLAGLKAERATLFRMGRHREIDDDIVRRLVREVDLLEARYAAT
jgi:CPA1 family monovalent cation:H+ antiporter